MTNGNGNGHGPSREERAEWAQEDFIDYCGRMVDSSDHRSFLAATYWVNLYAEVIGGAGIPHEIHGRTPNDIEILSLAEGSLFEELVISVYEPGAPMPETAEDQAVQLLGEMIFKRHYLAANPGRGRSDR